MGGGVVRRDEPPLDGHPAQQRVALGLARHQHGLRVLDGGGRVVEVPIEFRERELGESKMSQAIVVEAMLRVTQWGFRRRLQTLLGNRPGPGWVVED